MYTCYCICMGTVSTGDFARPYHNMSWDILWYLLFLLSKMNNTQCQPQKHLMSPVQFVSAFRKPLRALMHNGLPEIQTAMSSEDEWLYLMICFKKPETNCKHRYIIAQRNKVDLVCFGGFIHIPDTQLIQNKLQCEQSWREQFGTSGYSIP